MSRNRQLSKYRQKRNASSTPEPFGYAVSPTPGLSKIYVFHQHLATRAHFDLRLEWDGVLLSWAVPKGPSLSPKTKRLAVKVEDHPLEYAEFEGIIPKENYGAGPVILWDRGVWTPLEDPIEGFRAGKILFEIDGYKLRGRWTLVKLKKSKRDWLFIKENDAYVSEDHLFSPYSVLSGKTVEELKKKTKTPRTLRPPVFKGPMLATTAHQPFERKNWIHELKYDGYRLQILKHDGEVHLYSRNGRQMNEVFPEISRSILERPQKSFLIDGEIVILDSEKKPSFQLLQKRAKLKEKREISQWTVLHPATFFAFDLLDLNGEDLRNKPLEERKKILKRSFQWIGPIRYSEHFSSGKDLFKKALELRLEGIVSKNKRSKYLSRRSENWLRIRCDRVEDFVVVGFTKPQRTRPAFGALLLGSYEKSKLKYTGRVGTGFSDQDLKEIKSRLHPIETPKGVLNAPDEKGLTWVKPEVVVEVRYKQLNEVLRHSAFLRLRDDKPPNECVLPGSETKKIEFQAPKNEVIQPPKKLTLSNLDKVYWPKEKIKKGALIEYYQKISRWILPYLKDRPIVLTRFPDGIEGKSFYQKDAPVFTPKWIRTHGVWSESGEREIRYFVCDQTEALQYLANLGTIPIHVWSSRTMSLELPDWCVLDLDPKLASFKSVVEVARGIQSLCQEVKLPHFLKTSGSSGLHVLIPLTKAFTHEQCKTLGELLATVITQRYPKISTIIRSPAKRGKKVYVDYLQNGFGKTIASPFCVRPNPGAPVSFPLKWSELNFRLDPREFNIKTALKIMKHRKDPMKEILNKKPNLERSLGLLSNILKGRHGK